MAIAANLGFPRIGARRELKRAVEEYWAGTIDPEELYATAAAIRRRHWQLQRSLGIEHIPSHDFSLYDHVLDTAAMVGAVPKRFAWTTGVVDLPTYFAMARGTKEIPPLDMTKWFDTNYHYIVPEFEPGMRFRVASTEPIKQFQEAAVQGVHTRPVLLGPLTLLLLGKCKRALKPLSLLDKLLPVYEEVLWRLAHAGADWVQIDEPVLALDLPHEFLAALASSCARLSAASDRIRICLTTYLAICSIICRRCSSCPWRPYTSTWCVRPNNWIGRWRRCRGARCCRWVSSTAATCGAPTWSGRWHCWKMPRRNSAPSGS